MRNLKRALSLALASVMVLGMMVVGAGAASFDDFSDKDKIVNTEAVSILNTLNVINGKDDGSFDPTGIVTRAEMAKMICVVLNGGKDPNLGTSATTSYTDTANTWAAGYIEFCTNQKIVGGDGTGKFNPTATVTGQEAAKMILVAMGYDATFETMTGAAWATSVNVLANKNGLYDSLTINPSAGLSRDDAAQMIYNALDAEMVYYDYAIIPSNGTLDSIATAKTYDKSTTILTEHFKAVKVEGIVVGNEAANLTETQLPEAGKLVGSSRDEGKTNILVTNYEDGQDKYKNAPAVFSVSSDVNYLGQSVSFYVKPGNTSEKSTVVGGLILSTDNKVVKDYSGDKASDVLDDNDLKAAKDAVFYKNYMNEDDVTSSKLADAGEAGVERIFIDNDGDGEVEIIFVNYTFLGKVTKYSTKDDGSITVKTDGYSFEIDDADDVVGFDDVAKDDYVLVSSYGGKLYVNKAETLEGTIDAFKGSNGKVTGLTVDGTKYDTTNPSFKVPSDLDMIYTTATAKDLLDMDTIFYLDAQGKIIARGDADETAYRYALVIGADKGNNLDGGRVKVVLEDGTTATYYVNSKSDVKAADLADKPGTVVAYSITSDDEIKMTETKGSDDGTAADFTKGKTTVKGTDMKTAYATSGTVFFYVSTDKDGDADYDDVTVYTGYSKAPSVDGGAVATHFNNSGKLMAVVFTGADANTNVSDHLFLYDTGSEGTSTIEGKVFLAGSDEKETITINKDDSDEIELDQLYTYTTNSDDEYVLKAVKSSNIVENVIVTNSTKTTVVAAPKNNTDPEKEVEYQILDTTITLDNHDDGATPDATKGANKLDEGTKISVVYNSDKEALMIVITELAPEA